MINFSSIAEAVRQAHQSARSESEQVYILVISSLRLTTTPDTHVRAPVEGESEPVIKKERDVQTIRRHDRVIKFIDDVDH